MIIDFIPTKERHKTRKPTMHRKLTEDERKFIFSDSGPHVREEILKRLEKDEIYMGKNPRRTFIYYQELGLLKPSGKKGKNPIFYSWNHLLIKSIRKARQAGHSLSYIKEGVEISKGGKCGDRGYIARVIGRKRAYTYSHSQVGGWLGIPYFYTISPGDDGIKIFKVESKTPANYFTLSKDLSVSEEGHLTLKGYSDLCGLVAVDILKITGGLPRRDDFINALVPEIRPPGLFVKYDGLSFMEKEKF